MSCCNPKVRHISELSSDPLRPLTQDQVDHIEEYLTPKNHDISAADVPLAGAVSHVIDNFDHYLGIPGAVSTNVRF